MADKIDELAGLDDTQLSAKLGLTAQLDGFKEALEEAKTLSGEARKKVAEQLEEQFQPRIWPGDLKHAVARAKRKADGKTHPEDLCCTGFED